MHHFFSARTHVQSFHWLQIRTSRRKDRDKVQKILDGVSPDKIRSEAANDVELIFNLKDATALGMKLSMELVTEATRLIK